MVGDGKIEVEIGVSKMMIGVWRIGGGKNEVLIGVSEEVIRVPEEVIGLSE
ncbi:hypothetical protein Tco_0670628, partial [Tanacetum coccineum]